MIAKITGAQIRIIKTLVGKLGVQDAAAMVRGFSECRTERVSELTIAEASAMIKQLKSMDPEEVGAEKMRRKLIGLAYTYKALPRSASKAEKEDAIKFLNDWCKKYGSPKKALNDYTYNELPTIISQFEKVNVHLMNNI